MDNHLIPEQSPRFQKIDKAALLSLCPLFSSLSSWEIKSISQLMRLTEYRKDETVYREGEAGESFYVVVSGRLEVHADSQGKKKVLAYLRRGDYFGEMSILTKEPHSASVQALSDTLLLVLKKEDFEKTIEHNASISLEISKRLSARLTGSAQEQKWLVKSDVISLFSNQRKNGRLSFGLNLCASLFHETHQKAVLVEMCRSESESSFGFLENKRAKLSSYGDIKGSQSNGSVSEFLFKHPLGFDVLSVAYDETGPSSDDAVLSLLNHLAAEYRFILLDLPGFMDSIAQKMISQSDSVYFVTDSSINNITEVQGLVEDVQKNLSFAQEKVSIVIHEVFMGIRTTATARRELFGSRFCYSLPAISETPVDWASANPYCAEDPDSDYSRVVRHIARRISGNLVGLVLGSGAALGLAHIGVLKVLEREKIPVDIIAGSSIGALVGALYAVGRTADEIEGAATEMNGPWSLVRLLDFNLFPIRGFFAGKLVMKKYRKHLGDKTFDDCRIPLKIMAANLTTRRSMVIDSGFVSDAVRVSIAIPAIFTPVLMNNRDVVIDGGILSPLPVHAAQAAGANKIIAVNVFPSSKDMLEKRIFDEELEEKQAKLMRQKNIVSQFFYKLKRRIGNAFRANIFDVLMNTIQTMETEISEIESLGADVLIRPVVASTNWAEFYKPQRLIRKGEEDTMKQIAKIKALVSAQGSL